jgi:hypothetical protein
MIFRGEAGWGFPPWSLTPGDRASDNRVHDGPIVKVRKRLPPLLPRRVQGQFGQDSSTGFVPRSALALP